MALTDIKLPDIGNFDEVDVIDIAVAVGDTVAKDDSLMTLESDKASMDVPAEMAGVIKEILVKVGDKVKEGDLIFRIEASEAAAPAAVKEAPKEAPKAAEKPAEAPKVEAPKAAAAPISPVPAANTANQATLDFSGAHASPSVRAFARELGADLNQIKGSGPKLRIMREDVVAYVKAMMTGAGSVGAVGTNSGGGLSLLPWPKVDFAKFGEITREPMSRIKKISGANLARNWAMIPHVTQFDESDVTELEAFRKQLNKENEKSGKKVTMLAFLVKACVHALKKFPEFNSSLDGDDLILKNYYHIGFAADTPNGLVVPVIRDCDQKSVLEIASEMGELAKLAREGKLKPDQMQGGCFTISSLGGIGGTAFTPIINAPEVAILGVSRTDMKPVWNGSSFEPRLMLPLSLSYDHRVIDGAAGARFIVHLNQCLTDMRRILV